MKACMEKFTKVGYIFHPLLQYLIDWGKHKSKTI